MRVAAATLLADLGVSRVRRPQCHAILKYLGWRVVRLPLAVTNGRRRNLNSKAMPALRRKLDQLKESPFLRIYRRLVALSDYKMCVSSLQTMPLSRAAVERQRRVRRRRAGPTVGTPVRIVLERASGRLAPAPARRCHLSGGAQGGHVAGVRGQPRPAAEFRRRRTSQHLGSGTYG